MRLPLPNLLASRRGRLIAFFLLYATEGLPLGFVATAVATQLRRDGVGPAEIGALVGSFYLPWAFKWAMGPIIDVFGWRRVGHRRGWIILTQLLMAATLMATSLIPLPGSLWLFSAVLLVHNGFGAMQDVAIDALACNTLGAEERGIANGMMFAGSYLGMTLGGGGVLMVTARGMPFGWSFAVVAGLLLSVTVLVVLPMREPPSPEPEPSDDSPFRVALRQMHAFSVGAFTSFLGTRGALAGVLFSLLPPGAMCLGLAVQTTLAVEFGMDDDAVGRLNLFSSIVSAGFCILGGFLSDRLGRRRTLTAYLLLMGAPVVVLMLSMSGHGWIEPVDVAGKAARQVPEGLLRMFWITTLAYSAVQGLMYGTRSAIMMDVTNPRVAGTQFTAYMALANVAIAYSATWQGKASEAWGYPTMMLIDVLFGAVCIALVPLLVPARTAEGTPRFSDGRGALRARIIAALLATGCLLVVPLQYLLHGLPAVAPIASTFVSLLLVLSAVFLLAGGAVLSATAPTLARAAAWFAPNLFLLPLRGAIVNRLALTENLMEVVALVVPVGAAVFLAAYAAQPWSALDRDADAEAA